MGAFRVIYKYWVSLLTLAVLVQIGFAGYGAFDTAHKVDDKGKTIDQDTFEDSFGPHIALGYLILLGAIVLLLLSFGARGRARILSSLGAVVLVIVQILLAWTGGSAPYIAGALHPINAFLILGLLGSITARGWKGDRMGAHAHTTAPPPPA